MQKLIYTNCKQFEIISIKNYAFVKVRAALNYSLQNVTKTTKCIRAEIHRCFSIACNVIDIFTFIKNLNFKRSKLGSQIG